MPHRRRRYAAQDILRALSFSPIVGILGHRQVGKTTLLESIARTYRSMDDEDVLRSAEAGPKAFVARLRGLRDGIDECQRVPALFPALKERVRVRRTPGQFLLTGSVRFTSRRAIRESLTGRIVNCELFPFTISEIKGLPLSDLGPKLVSRRVSSEDELARLLPAPVPGAREEIERYATRGGLPGLWLMRDDRLRERRLAEQLATILDRDIRQVYPTTLSYRQLLDFLTELALREGRPLRFSDIARKVRIADATQHKLLYAMEAVFLIRVFPVAGGMRGPVVRLEDQAESAYLRSILQDKADPLPPAESMLYRHVRVQFAYHAQGRRDFFHYQTRGGARVPLAVQTADGVLGFMVTEEPSPARSHLAGAASFFKAYPNSRIVYVSTDPRAAPAWIDGRSFSIPLRYFV